MLIKTWTYAGCYRGQSNAITELGAIVKLIFPFGKFQAKQRLGHISELPKMRLLGINILNASFSINSRYVVTMLE